MQKMNVEESHAFINSIVSMVENGFPEFADAIREAECVKIFSIDPSFIRVDVGGVWGLGQGYNGTESIIDDNRIVLSKMNGTYSLDDIKTIINDKMMYNSMRDAFLL